MFFDSFFNAFFDSIDLLYFLCLMFCGELVKKLPIFNHSKKTGVSGYELKIKNRLVFHFNFKWVILILGILLGVLFTILMPMSGEVSQGKEFLKIILTFSITLTLYDFLFKVIIIKFKQFLNKLITMEIKPVKIDVSNTYDEPGSCDNNPKQKEHKKINDIQSEEIINETDTDVS